MNFQRILTLSIIILLLIGAKFWFLQFITGPFVFPDENGYGNGLMLNSLSDLSIYSLIPNLLGYETALYFNCILSSLCSLPIFFLLRQRFSERVALLGTIALAFWSPLWLYSFVNMTEAMLFFICLNALLLTNKFSYPIQVEGENLTVSRGSAILFLTDLFAFVTKSLGAVAILARFNQGFVLAIVLGFFWAAGQHYPIDNYALNFIHSFVRSIGYILVGSFGLIALPIQRYQDGIADALDKYALRFMLALFLILLAPMVAIPAAYFYGRYLDVGLLLILPIALIKAPTKSELRMCALILIIGLVCLYGVPSDLVLDSSLQFLPQTLINILSLQ